VPPGTVSFALIFHDRTSRYRRRSKTSCTGWHSIFRPRLMSCRRRVRKRAIADGTVQAKNRAERRLHGAGAPAAGPHHHYTFELFALDIKLDLGADATRADVLKAMDAHSRKGRAGGRFTVRNHASQESPIVMMGPAGRCACAKRPDLNLRGDRSRP